MAWIKRERADRIAELEAKIDETYYKGTEAGYDAKTIMGDTEARKRIAELEEKLSTWDRILRASCPERCRADSPVGTVQNYIAELEEGLRKANQELMLHSPADYNLLAELQSLLEGK